MKARFEQTMIEVGTGKGYRWTPAVIIIKPDGTKLFPPVQEREARAICKREGWQAPARNWKIVH